jgi:hypothetical protein
MLNMIEGWIEVDDEGEVGRHISVEEIIGRSIYLAHKIRLETEIEGTPIKWVSGRDIFKIAHSENV